MTTATKPRSKGIRVKLRIPPKLQPVFQGPADTRGAYGGRGSGKTRTFAQMVAAYGVKFDQEGKTGVIVCGREFMNSLAESSFAEVRDAILETPWLRNRYDIGDKYIRTKSKRIQFAFIGLKRNLSSIKSKSRILLLWVDEAENVSEEAWEKALPTVRENGSETWVTWNPERKGSATDKRFRQDPPAGSKIVEINYQDNPWFPAKLDRQRLEDKAKRPDSYEHIWDGGYKTHVEGAYWSSQMIAAKEEGRICELKADPLMTYRAFWDIGGTGAKADACTIWIAQFIGKEVNVLDYYEAQGQPLATHINWLKGNGYESALCVLPHDGETHDKVHDVSFDSALRKAGFETQVVPNQGKGAAMMRVEAARELFPQIHFNESTTDGGRLALSWYHEKIDTDRGIGLGPDHDWSSHASDAFGLMAISYNQQPMAGNINVRFAM